MPSAVPGLREPALKNLFELSHDSLGEIFQQFSVEFEGWVRSRWAKLLGIVFGGFIGLPILLIAILAIGFFQALLGAVVGIGILVLYIGMIWIMTKIMEFLYELIAFPIIRRLAKGVVPLPFSRSRK